MSIKKPVVTEKSVQMYKNHKKATFEVDLKANKRTVKKAIEEIYGVTVLKVWSKTIMGKRKEDRTNRKVNKLADKKIMVVQLSSRSKIEAFESQ